MRTLFDARLRHEDLVIFRIVTVLLHDLHNAIEITHAFDEIVFRFQFVIDSAARRPGGAQGRSAGNGRAIAFGNLPSRAISTTPRSPMAMRVRGCSK